jgi:hypothetical protein
MELRAFILLFLLIFASSSFAGNKKNLSHLDFSAKCGFEEDEVVGEKYTLCRTLRCGAAYG